MNQLPNEIWMDIILKLDIHSMLNINIISSKFHTLIKKYEIPDNSRSHTIKLKNTDDINNRLEILITEYKFKKYNLSYCYNITDESVKLLDGLHTLILINNPQITDESVKLLGKLHTLNLSYCEKITDESVKLLGGLHTL
uniref:Leucine-rich repeat protein n=1 Tax=Pithovirus LCPAC102 TaxID=2506587 RepID=A0A481Z3M0_9VIRU|nr:MAG: leucine-rich repeat protein [Pithovirus LCPAC102]